uniref:Ion transport domain-containing protein n=1 Tax=Rhizophagus irregularis (strain DAOM 181602 / DAOM 197198 / MUCL 43194) TaxID=747089 RepID=U9U095_RHIID
MTVMSIFSRKYYKSHPILVFLMYIVSIIGLIICVVIDATIPYDIFNEEDRKYLFFFSIILGFIHLLFEVRQFIWSPFRWISDIWNLFDLSAYLVPGLTSICWIYIIIMRTLTKSSKLMKNKDFFK